MKENQVSRTAQWTAFYRAFHFIYDYPKIFNDFLAQRIIEEGEIEAFGQQMAGIKLL
jgi:O-methyltransferase involved in polyketide biosynthesis